jgi:hypothetical protein
VAINAEQRRALRVIAEAEPEGATQATLEAHGFKLQLAIDLIKAGFANARIEAVRAGEPTIRVARVVLTSAGRRALAH